MKFINIHTHIFTSDQNILELVNQYPLEFNENVEFYSIGIHPWNIKHDKIEAELSIIDEKLKSKNCLAIGECGLDKRIEIPFNEQLKVFEKQLYLAEKHNKPVIIHCVSAFQEVIALKKELKISVPMIIHGFSKNKQIADQLIKAGFYISFGKFLLKNPGLKDVFKNIPNNRFFLETDTIKENIKEVYDIASSYKELKINELKELILSNYESVFIIKNN